MGAGRVAAISTAARAARVPAHVPGAWTATRDRIRAEWFGVVAGRARCSSNRWVKQRWTEHGRPPINIPKRQEAEMTELPSLYDRLGGVFAIAVVVDP
jgi:hypothetical protein